MVRKILYSIINSKSQALLKTRINLIKMYITPINTYAGEAWAPYIKRHHWLKHNIESSNRTQSKSFFHKNTFSVPQHISELGRFLTDPPPITNKPKELIWPLAWAL